MKLKLLPTIVGAALLASCSALALGPPLPPLPPLPGLPSVNVRIALSAPPPPRPMVVVSQPGPQHIWADGYWDYRGSDWAWTEGRWLQPPGRHVGWVKASYVRVQGGWRYAPAHWSNQRVIVKNAGNPGHHGKQKGPKKHKH